MFQGFLFFKLVQFESLGLIGLFLSAFISSTVAPGGSEVVLAYLVNQHHYVVEHLIGIATIGNTLGAMTTWWLGVWTAKKFPTKMMSESRQQKSMYWVQRWGAWALLFSWLPIVGDGFCFAAGWLKIPLLLSFTAIFIGKVLRYMAIAYAVF